MKHRSLQMAVFLLAAAFILSACGGGGGGGGGGQAAPKVQLSGTVSSGTKTKAFFSALGAPAFAPSVTVDSVWAIPIAKMQGANIDRFNVMMRKTASVALDGSFSFTLEKSMTLADIVAKVPTIETNGWPLNMVFEVDWLLIQMTGSTPVKVIRLQGDTTYDSMMTIPLSAFTPSTMNLGAVTDGDGLATLTVAGIAGSVTLSSGNLATVAKTDDILGAITDIIRNCDTGTSKCYSARQSHVFTGDYTQITADMTAAASYSGYQIYFDLNDYFDKADFAGICPGAAGPVTVEYRLTPPATISVGTGSYSVLSSDPTATGDPQTSGDGSEVRCFKSNLYLSSSTTTSNWQLQFVTGDMDQITSNPPGDWTLSRTVSGTTTTLARFEFALAKPVDNSGNPIVIIPAIMLATDGAPNYGVNTVYVTWWRYDSISAGYVQVTDPALLTSLIGGFEISLDDQNGITTNLGLRRAHAQVQVFDPSGQTAVNVADLDGKGKYYYNYPAEDRYELEYIGVSYEFGGQSFRFAWATYIP